MEFKGTKGERYVRYMTVDGVDDGECDVFVEAVEPKNQIGKIEILMDDFGEHNGYPREQKIADAKLDAAAPKLLGALRQIREQIRFPSSVDHKTVLKIIDELAETAIKKALG